MIAPITHEMIAAGPASVAAVSAPNSQPEPMIEPTLAKSSPTTPMSRRIFAALWVGASAARSLLEQWS